MAQPRTRNFFDELHALVSPAARARILIAPEGAGAPARVTGLAARPRASEDEVVGLDAGHAGEVDDEVGARDAVGVDINGRVVLGAASTDDGRALQDFPCTLRGGPAGTDPCT